MSGIWARRRTAGPWRTVKATVTALAVVVVACGSGSPDPAATTAGRSTDPDAVTIPAAPTGMVVAGDDAGWMADTDSRVWRVARDGTVDQTGTIPTYNRPVATFFAGRVVFGGTRCDGQVDGEACRGEAVMEVRLLEETGRQIATVELFRRSGSRYRSTGIDVKGSADGRLWLASDVGDVFVVDRDGTISRPPVPSGPDAPSMCLVGGDLYGIHDASAPADVDAGAGATPTVIAPDDLDAAQDEAWTVSRRAGDSWQPVANGSHRRNGPEATVTCLSEGFVLHSYATLDEPFAEPPLAVWTPARGWHEPTGAIAALGAHDVLTTETNGVYAVRDGQVLRISIDRGARPTGIDEWLLGAGTGMDSGPLRVGSVDDAGEMLIACGEASPSSTRCVLASAATAHRATDAEAAPAPAAPRVTPAPQASAVEFWLHQFNVCSLVCQDKIEDRNDPLALVVFMEAVDKPGVISLNEICQSEIKRLVDTTGMNAAWILTKRRDGDCPGPASDQRFGNAILFRHPAADRGIAWWFQEQEAQDPPCTPEPAWSGANECRGMVCLNVNTPVGTSSLCSAHLESSSRTIAEVQSAEYMFVSAAYTTGTRYLAGDFNLRSHEIHGSFEDLCAVDSSDAYLTHDAVLGLDKKIDYIWRCPGPYLPGTPLRLPLCDGTYSDHCYIFTQQAFA